MTMAPLQCVDHSKPLSQSQNLSTVSNIETLSTYDIKYVHHFFELIAQLFKWPLLSYPIHWLYLNKRYICTSLWYDTSLYWTLSSCLSQVCVTVLKPWQRWYIDFSIFPAIRIIRISTTLQCTQNCTYLKIGIFFQGDAILFSVCLCAWERERYAPDVEKFFPNDNKQFFFLAELRAFQHSTDNCIVLVKNLVFFVCANSNLALGE